MDDSQKTPPDATPIPSTEVPISPQEANPPPTVDAIPQSVLKKHSSPLSFKSLSVIILVLLVGSVFVVSGLSSSKDSLDVRSRASKKEDKSLLKNGAFAQQLLGWKQGKKDKGVSVSVVSDANTGGAKALKIVNSGSGNAVVYQDIKVTPDTYYTIRANGMRLEGNGSATLLLEEYNLVAGKPKFIKKSLAKKIFNTSSFQTRGAIVKTGSVFLANKLNKNITFIEQVSANTSCPANKAGQCSTFGECSSGQRCVEHIYQQYGDENEYTCDPDVNCRDTPPPQVISCNDCLPYYLICNGNCQQDCAQCGQAFEFCKQNCINDNTSGNQSGGQNPPPLPPGDTSDDTGGSGDNSDGGDGGDGNDGGDGGGSGGSTPTDKYVRISLVMSKKGTAYFKNVKFEPGKINSAPKITSTPPTTASAGAQLRYQVKASDPDGDTLGYGLGTMPCSFDTPQCKQEKLSIPRGATITQAGLFTYTPEAAGTAKIRLWVTDGMKPVKQDFTLTIR